MQSIPTLTLLGLLLYIDRILRREVIFDSSALTCTIFVAHVCNICRSSIAHVDDPSSRLLGLGSSLPLASTRQLMIMGMLGPETETDRGGSRNVSMHLLKNNSSPGLSAGELQLLQRSQRKNDYVGSKGGTVIPLSWWQEDLAYVLYAAASILLLLDIDVVSWVLPPSAHCASAHLLRQGGTNGAAWTMSNLRKRSQHPARGGTGNSNIVRISTVVTHCILVGIVLQMQVEASIFMTPAKVMARSFAFMAFSICWTYAVGIQDACIATRYFPYYVNPYHLVSECEDDQSVLHVSSTGSGSSAKGLTGGSCRRKQRHQPNRLLHAYAEDVSGADAISTQQQQQQQVLQTPATMDAAYGIYIQPFTPCQLRFAVILFSDSWHMPLAAIAMGVIMADKLQKAVCHPFATWATFSSSSSSSASSFSAMETSNSEEVPRKKPYYSQSHFSVEASALEAPSVSLITATSSVADFLHGKKRRDQPTASGSSPSNSSLPTQSDAADMDETLALFRKAQMQASATVSGSVVLPSPSAAGALSSSPSDPHALHHHPLQVPAGSSAWRHPPHERLGEML